MSNPLQASISIAARSVTNLSLAMAGKISVAASMATTGVVVSPNGNVLVQVGQLPQVSITVSQPPQTSVTANLGSIVQVNVGFGSSGGSGSGNFSFVSSIPIGTDGNVGDIRCVTTTGKVYEKTATTTWTFRFQFPTSVTNIKAFYLCPDGTTRGSNLTP